MLNLFNKVCFPGTVYLPETVTPLLSGLSRLSLMEIDRGLRCRFCEAGKTRQNLSVGFFNDLITKTKVNCHQGTKVAKRIKVLEGGVLGVLLTKWLRFKSFPF